MGIYFNKKREDLLFWGCMLAISTGSFWIWKFINTNLGIDGYLNVDDLASIQFALEGNNLFEKLYGVIQNDPTNVPLFYILLYFWMRLFGFQPVMIRILPEIFAALFIVVMGMIGRKAFHAKLGIIAAILCAVSIQLLYASFQIRAYSLLMLCSGVLFLVWLYREENKYAFLLMEAALLLVSFSHFFGVLVCGAFGSWEIICCVSEKKTKKFLLPYVIYVFLFGPYVLLAYTNAGKIWGTFWTPVPDYLDFFEMLESLCAVKNVGFFVLICMFYIRIFVWRNTKEKNKNCGSDHTIWVCFWVIFSVLMVGFVYSRYISPTRSVWVFRYFLVLFPFVLCILAYGIVYFWQWMKNILHLNQVMCAAIPLAFACFYFYQNIEYALVHGDEINTGGSDYAAISDYLSSQEDINDKHTLVIFPYPKPYFAGWIGFYTQGGRLELPNIYCTSDWMNGDLDQYDNIYTIEVVYDLTEQESSYIKNTYQLTEANGNSLAKVNKYSRK